MFAHGGLFHIVMNSMALIGVAPPLVARLGGVAAGGLRLLALFALSGLAGMAFFLAVHPTGEVPMLGASGAIYGLLGYLLRLQGGGGLLPIRSPRMRKAAVQFVKENLFLFLLLTVPALLRGEAGGVAWEAHLGGFLFGVFIAPLLFAPPGPQAADHPAGG
jgi:membrane associated rhomboid family serine protease